MRSRPVCQHTCSSLSRWTGVLAVLLTPTLSYAEGIHIYESTFGQIVGVAVPIALVIVSFLYLFVRSPKGAFYLLVFVVAFPCVAYAVAAYSTGALGSFFFGVLLFLPWLLALASGAFVVIANIANEARSLEK